MAVLTTPIGQLRRPNYVQGRRMHPFRQMAMVPSSVATQRDWRQQGGLAGFGVIKDRVMIKLTPSSPESPYPNARVWLLRAADGFKAWEGFSDAQGWYTARRLEVGVVYIATAIDPAKEHKSTGAGPVVAVHMDTLT